MWGSRKTSWMAQPTKKQGVQKRLGEETQYNQNFQETVGSIPTEQANFSYPMEEQR